MSVYRTIGTLVFKFNLFNKKIFRYVGPDMGPELILPLIKFILARSHTSQAVQPQKLARGINFIFKYKNLLPR